jgi:DNA-binding transcriptional ArsR family regulator
VARASGDRGRHTDDRAAGVPALASAAGLLKALSHPVRLKIVEVLIGGELCVKRLGEILDIPQPTVSQHLSRLKAAGLVESERRGHLVCYRLSEDRAAGVFRAAVRGPRARGESREERSAS